MSLPVLSGPVVVEEDPLDLMDEIDALKKEKDATILAHFYVDGDIQDIADFTGGEHLHVKVEDIISSSSFQMRNGSEELTLPNRLAQAYIDILSQNRDAEQVFFDFDSSDLSVEAQEVVSSAVEEARHTGAVRIEVVGHTDTAHAQPGSQAAHDYNQALSERRAEAVRAEMIRLGMNGNEIVSEGRSYDDPLVPTGPGVREPQNRRAVIDLGN